MQITVLGRKQTRPTARMLAWKLGADYSEAFLGGSPTVVLRYGNSTTPSPDSFEFNKSRSVAIASQKVRCRGMLISRGISVPKTMFSPDEINEGFDPKKFYIARPPHHFQGRNFYVTKSYDDISKYLRIGYYVQELIEKADEYRVFVFRDKIMEASIKTKSRANADMLIRNHRRGWKFNHVPVADLPDILKRTCRSSAGCIGIDFCAIDCCLGEDGKFYILEINSAPGLIERKADVFVTKFMEYVGEAEARFGGFRHQQTQEDPDLEEAQDRQDQDWEIDDEGDEYYVEYYLDSQGNEAERRIYSED
jgi:hypothetical protein